MKFISICVLIFSLSFISTHVSGQVKYQAGAALEDRDNHKLNRVLGSDATGYYCYRVRYEGGGTDYYIEKYDNSSMKLLFEKKLEFGDSRYIKIEDILFLKGSVNVFVRTYDKEKRKVILSCISIDTKGTMGKMQEVLTLSARYLEFSFFNVYVNSLEQKILVKFCQKDAPENPYQTTFYLVNRQTLKTEWSKKLGQALLTEKEDDKTKDFLLGLFFDDNDDIYYGVSSLNDKSKKNDKYYDLNLYCLAAAEKTAKILPLQLKEGYQVSDVKFSKSDKNLSVGGFYKDMIERKGRDYAQCGVFCFNVAIPSFVIASQTTKDFDDQLTQKLDLSIKHSKQYRYKIDYIFRKGTDVYLVGEQYNVVAYMSSPATGSGSKPVTTYMDVIVTKINAKGECEWIKNAPLRQKWGSAQIFKQYVAVISDKQLYVMYNENPSNAKVLKDKDYDPSDLEDPSSIHGSNFVYNSFALTDGKMVSGLIFKNKDYCFAPIQDENPEFFPPEDAEIFIKSPLVPNEIYIYTEDRGDGQFGKLSFE